MHLNGGTLASLWALPEGSSVCFKVLATNRSTRPASRASPQRSVPTALPLPLHSAEPTPGITVRSGGHSRGPPGARGSRPSPISPVGGTMSFEDSIRHRKRGAPMRLHGGKQTACALLTTPGGTAEGKWSLLTPMIVVHRKPGSPFSAAAFDKTTAWSGAGTALGISRWPRPRPGPSPPPGSFPSPPRPPTSRPRSGPELGAAMAAAAAAAGGHHKEKRSLDQRARDRAFGN